jgi:peptide/nickel transport system permease protein
MEKEEKKIIEAHKSRLRMRAIFRNAMPFVGMFLLVLTILSAVFAPVLAPFDPTKQSLRERLRPPVWEDGGSWKHPIGTDYLGRDILSRILYGARVSLMVGFFGIVIASGLGVTFGTISGYFGGKTDLFMMRGMEIFLAIPRIIFAVMMVVLFGGGVRNMILFMGISSWTWLARVVRSRVLSIKTEDFIKAAKALGASDSRIMFSHILPNIVNVVIVIGVMQFAYIIILESTLSFLGITGFDLSWGLDVSMGRNYITFAWWPSTMPGAAIFITVTGIMMFGYWLRDVFDPHVKFSQ